MISIIVPIYNVEKYLSRCIESVLNQNFNDYELILVNDGSTDESESICRKYSKDNNKISLISQENRGVSAARNAGIDKSCGEYILFLDADDYLCANALQTLICEIESYDIIIFGYNIISEDNKKLDSRIIKAFTTVKFEERFEEYTKMKALFLINPPFNKMFRRDLLSIKFDEHFRMGEDLLFCINYLKNCMSIKVIDKALYCYIQRKGSATKTFQVDRVENEIKLFYHEKNFVETYFSKYDISVISKSYSSAIRDCFIAIHGSSCQKEHILKIFKKWSRAIKQSNFVKYDSNNALKFINSNVNTQYKYSLKEYGLIKKVIKKIFVFFSKRGV